MLLQKIKDIMHQKLQGDYSFGPYGGVEGINECAAEIELLLRQTPAIGSFPFSAGELKQIFLNKFDCYTEGVDDNGDHTEPAMTFDRFVEVVKLITGGNDR